jgi:mono/diheme cytochrome c family protein
VKSFLFGVVLAGLPWTSLPLSQAQNRSTPTYNRDVQPILQKACVACHSPGQIAPMSFATYENTRAWATQIKAVVEKGKMPPGTVERHYGMFGDDGALTRNEIDTIVRWVDAGAPEGAAQEAKPPRSKSK